MGKPTRPGILSRFVPSIVLKLLDRGGCFDLVIVDTASADTLRNH